MNIMTERRKAVYDMSDVCASIITYNCESVINKNIISLLEQVNHILIIDNNSNADSNHLLDQWNNNEKITIIKYPSNEGLALRLNEALEWATEHNYSLLLTMDQDTVLKDNAVIEMLKVLNSTDQICSVGPNRNFKEYDSNRLYTNTNYLITSGNLLKISVANKIKGYDSTLFIDLVDIDFSLHLRSEGYLLAIANNAEMEHKVGELEINKFLFFKYKYLSHSPIRFYYIYRNHVIISKKYFNQFSMFLIKLRMLMILDTFKILFEKNSFEKLKYALKGIVDGKKIIKKEK